MDFSVGPKIMLAGVTGYLLGSISPAYFLGKALKKIDVRDRGYRNAGVRNVYHLLGVLPAVVTAIINLGKGIAAVLISERLLYLPDIWLGVAAWAAVLGHIFPFYLRFRGGKGMATSIGVYLLLCALAMAEGSFAPTQLAAVLAVAALVFVASRSGDLTSLVAFFFLSILTPLQLGLIPRALLMLSLSGYCFALSVRNTVVQRVFILDTQIEMKWWRVIARPFALLFIPIDLLFGRTPLLFLMGGIGIVLIGMDIFRILSRHELQQLFKKKESKRFSSMTSFIVAIFIIFLVFPGVIPYLGLAYITIGDMFSKIIGIKFGTHGLLRDRTLEGSLGFLAGSFMAGWVLYTLLPVPNYVVIAGPMFATAVELFSMDLDDNFTVGIVTSGFLFSLHYFLGT
ncbi:MAG: glycerol-3-phosphate acyltransferase [Spirochaetaceae bacterium]|nr:MAG: glycerol-3-phosphate acyltransferase [Spirochaetaceae bacterium]